MAPVGAYGNYSHQHAMMPSLRVSMNQHMANFQDIHTTVEFEEWAYQQGLQASEQFLIQTYLDPQGQTLEAGTGGGRILLALQDLGFQDLSGFDYVPEFIDVAKQRDQNQSIAYTTQNASRLAYPDGSFDQVLYLQQVICYIDDFDARRLALQEAYRILKPGGLALFSFLMLDARLKSRFYATFIAYIQLLRRLRRSPRSIHALPSLQINRQNNYAALLDRPPYMYWYGIEEAAQVLQALKFKVIAIGTNHQIQQGQLLMSPEDLLQAPLSGQLYCVCRKA